MLRGEGESLASVESNEFHNVNASRSRKHSKYSAKENLDESYENSRDNSSNSVYGLFKKGNKGPQIDQSFK